MLSRATFQLSKSTPSKSTPSKSIPSKSILSRCLSSLACVGTLVAISSLASLPAHAQTPSENMLAMERSLEQEFESYFGEDLAEVTQSSEEITDTLQQVAAETQTQPAVLRAIPPGYHLHLVLLTSSGEPIVRDLYDVPDDLLRQTVSDFQLEMHGTAENMLAAQQLHKWMIEPFESEHLQPEEIDTLLVCLGNGLRSLPLAALHDGENFLISRSVQSFVG